jgi:hypothetical protein
MFTPRRLFRAFRRQVAVADAVHARDRATRVTALDVSPRVRVPLLGAERGTLVDRMCSSPQAGEGGGLMAQALRRCELCALCPRCCRADDAVNGRNAPAAAVGQLVKC